MIRILIIDDHALMRRGLRQILNECNGMEIVAEFSNGIDALHWTHANDCDVVLLDISMPGKSGTEILKQLHEENPGLPILILTMHPEDQYAVRLIKSGAAGYLTKETAAETVVEAVRSIAGGKKYINPAVAELLANEVSGGGKLPHEALSNREYQIFLLLASAKTVTEIADALVLSVKTVSTYRRRILKKMQLPNNVALMHYAIDKHFINSPGLEVIRNNASLTA